MRPRRRLLALMLLAASATAVLARRRRARAERVDVYFEDGSMVSLAAGSPPGERLLSVARSVLP